jgi:hypothetical protein
MQTRKVMNPDDTNFTRQRRGFVLAAVSAPALAVAAVVSPAHASSGPLATEDGPDDARTSAHRGYHETDHIRRYYALAAAY